MNIDSKTAALFANSLRAMSNGPTRGMSMSDSAILQNAADFLDALAASAPSQAWRCQASGPVSSRDAAEALLAAGHEFWLSVGRENYKAQGAVQWLTASDGSLVLFTRGEYKQTLLNNIAALPGAAVVNWKQPGDEDERGLIACSKDAPPAGRTLTDDAEAWTPEQLDGIASAVREACGPATAVRVRAILAASSTTAEEQS